MCVVAFALVDKGDKQEVDGFAGWVMRNEANGGVVRFSRRFCVHFPPPNLFRCTPAL